MVDDSGLPVCDILYVIGVSAIVGFFLVGGFFLLAR